MGSTFVLEKHVADLYLAAMCSPNFVESSTCTNGLIVSGLCLDMEAESNNLR